MLQVPSAADRVILVGDFRMFSPEELFDHWVDPVLLVQWWPKVATVEPRLGGRYKFEWPQPGFHLYGEYTSLERGKHLGFTWAWSHEPAMESPLQVDVYLEQLHEGTRMGIHHGPFALKDAEARQGVAEGWIHFGMLLAGLRDG